MINCIVIEDEVDALETIVEYVSELPYLNLIGAFRNPMDVLSTLETESVDLIFSDINMPKMDGLSFYKMLERKPFFIFITAYNQYALESYELGIVDYIMKPFHFERFVKAATRAKQLIHDDRNKKSVSMLKEKIIRIKDSGKILLFDKDDIYYFEALKDYVKIYHGDKATVVMTTMKDLEVNLPETIFCRIQKSFIVNVTKISTIEFHKLKLKNEIILPIGPKYRNLLFGRFNGG